MILLEADDITVSDGPTTLLQPVSLTLEAGTPLVVLGETGSGKSLLAQALMGTLPPGLATSGRVTLGTHRLETARAGRFRPLWGREIAVLPQEPWLSLDPLMRARAQVGETHRLVRALTAAEARRQAETDLARLGLDPAATQRYPHQLSGGMAQRVAIAAARAGGARIVIADEPTKGLDAARRDDVADLLLQELGQGGGLLVITHDLELAQRIGGRLMVLRRGEVVEAGETARVLAAPLDRYTRALIAADPRHWTPRSTAARAAASTTASTSSGPAVVSAHGLTVGRGGRTLIDRVDLDLRAGRIFGVTGPSGCGKSTLGDVLLGLVPPLAGEVRRDGGLPATAFQKLYQDPVAAFPRRLRLGRTLADVARRHGAGAGRIDALLERLGLDPVLLERLPDAVSGGELQRLALLRLLLVRPRFIFADEPTSRLDPITQAQVIQLLCETVEQDGCAVMLVSHDAMLIRNTADERLALGRPEGAAEPQPAGARPEPVPA